MKTKFLNIRNCINKNYLWLFFIIFLAIFLRFYQLGDIPSGVHADEAAWSYNAYSLLLTGKEEYGQTLPLVLKSFGDYKGVVYSYLDIPFVKFLGLNAVSTRIPSAISAVLLIIVLYFFTKKLIKNEKIALISAFLLTISPWHITLSRVAADFNIAILFIFLLAYSLLELIKKSSKKWLLIALGSGTLAIFSYTASRFFVILVCLMFIIFSVKKINNKLSINKLILAILASLLAIGIIYTYLIPASRFDQISIFSDKQLKLSMAQQIQQDGSTNPLITRFFHNKVVSYGRVIISNFQQYITGSFLFLEGGYPYRERIPDSGLFYLWQVPFLLIGLFALFRSKKKEYLFLFFWWIFLLLPAAITNDEIPNVHRALIVLPVMVIIVSIGIYELFKYKPVAGSKYLPKIFLFAIFTVGIFEFLYFEHQYTVNQKVTEPWYRGYAYKPLVSALREYYPDYKKIIVTKSQSSPYIYILFYMQYDPKKYQAQGSPRDLDYTGFDKYFFVPQDCPLDGGSNGKVYAKGRTEYLYIDKGTCATPINAKVLDVVKWEDGTPAFKIMQFLGGEPPSPDSKF